MPAEHTFDLYAKLVSKKKSHKHQSGEGCSNPPSKKSQTDDPPASTPTKETTPPPAPAREATPPPPRLSDQLSAVEARYTEQLKASEATHAKQLKVVKVKHSEALKEAEAKHTETLKEAEAKHLEALQVTEAKIASLEEELKKKEASIAKITASKEQYKDTSLINYQEAHKLQAELEISRKEVPALEEENACNLEDYEGAAFECFYLFWKNNPNANFSYLPDHIREAELARCVSR
ncbi:actin cytoskeleton-regulatory complex protein PAN1-like [Humulus lupulus]|uniref:actin cytoskeleton-regulatory complex protein PAN1-like n=1 Tax=Humulus lupulus TaxID=3486 RepID=UPI002B406EEA|nr:actin cytoskeleton-regulatory complex protein PAN1-like [Humulus lupulus]